jgi:hypothetical protein
MNLLDMKGRHAVITGGVSLGDQIQGSTPELRRVGSRHLTDCFRDDHRLNSGVRKSGSGSNSPKRSILFHYYQDPKLSQKLDERKRGTAARSVRLRLSASRYVLRDGGRVT